MKAVMILLLMGLLIVLSGVCHAKEVKWQKHDQNGQPVAIKMGPWSCATDNHSGLTWEVKSWHENSHYYKATYSYYEPKTGLGVKDGGSCQQGQEWYPCDVSDYIAKMNKQGYCGISNWRLPTLKELNTLIYKKNLPGKLKINPYIFPRTTRSIYMTADMAQLDGQWHITMMDFLRQRVQQRKLDVVANVRLVSGGRL